MRNSSLLALAALSSACAMRTHGDPSSNLTSTHLAWAPAPTAESATGVSATTADFATGDFTTAPAAPKLLGGEGYTRFSLGPFEPLGDIDVLDTGYYAQVAFGSDVLPFISLEASLGYASADDTSNAELTAVPLFFSGRVQVPIAILKIYGGLGVGGLWADYDFGPVSDDEFLLAGTAFLGADVGLGNLALGLEYRYITAEEADPGFTIEGQAILVCLTVPF